MQNDSIKREDLKKQLDQEDKNFHLIEVLGEDSYQKYHLPQAVNVPVQDENFVERVKELVPNKEDPIVVYCYDKDCDASEKAQKKLRDEGYTHVSDYTEGKVDWKEAGLPTA